MGRQHPAGQASIAHLQNIRSIIQGLAEEAHLDDPESFARSWHILMKGAIISATEGDADAAKRAKTMAQNLLDQHRSKPPKPGRSRATKRKTLTS